MKGDITRGRILIRNPTNKTSQKIKKKKLIPMIRVKDELQRK